MDDGKTAVTAATDVVELAKGPPRHSVIAGKYRVESTLGFGGMGIVLAAHHLQLDERVAIKILRDDVQLEPEHVERFIREAQAAVRLKSENVARIDDVGMLPDGKPYMVMELLEGLDLGRLLQEAGHLAAPLAVDYILQVCDALAEAHAIGIVHRDIKPTNLFVTSRRDGSPLIKVLDFGISKAASASDLSLTQTSSVLGTPAYMSPEQMRNARTADARSDLWSLATVLYELVEGTTPFTASSFAELCVAVALEDPRPLHNAPELESVLARALAKSPDDRYPSIAELADDLAPFSTDHRRAQRQVNRIFRLLGKQPPHPGARDSTPAMVPIRDSAPNIRARDSAADLRGRDSGANIPTRDSGANVPTRDSGANVPARDSSANVRAHAFSSEESAVANAASTIARARRHPMWLLAGSLALLGLGAAITLILMTTTSHEPALGSSAAGSAVEALAGSAVDATIADRAADVSKPSDHPDVSKPGGALDSAASSSGSSASAQLGSADSSAPTSDRDVGHATNAGSPSHTTHSPLRPTHRTPVRPPPHRPPPRRLPTAHDSAVPQAGPAAPPRPKCDPFANSNGCPNAPVHL